MTTPHLKNTEAEVTCIAAVIADPHCRDTLNLRVEDFSNERHQAMWQAILDCKTPDLASVSTLLSGKHGGNWLPTLVDYSMNSVTVNSLRYAELVREATSRRKGIEIAMELAESLAKAETHAIENALRSLQGLTIDTEVDSMTIGEAARKAVEAIAERRKGLVGVTSGIGCIDRVLGGMHPGDLIIIGARPGTGKTALMLQMALSSASKGVPIGLFSGEQAAPQLGERAIAATGVTTVSEMRSGRADPQRIDAAVEALSAASCHISDVSCPSISHVRKMARKWKHEYGIRGVFVDYLQRMSGDSKLQKHERVGNNARDLKTLATELQIPVIALAQVNRNVTNRADPRPNMSDLRDSGEIEQEADQIMLLYTDGTDEEMDVWPAEIILDKNRHGATGTFELLWDRQRMRFEEPKDA